MVTCVCLRDRPRPAWSFAGRRRSWSVERADQLFALEDVPDDLAGALLAPPVVRPPPPAAGAGIFDQLVMLGALRPEIVAPGRLLTTSLVWSGDPVDDVAEGVAAQLASAELAGVRFARRLRPYHGDPGRDRRPARRQPTHGTPAGRRRLSPHPVAGASGGARRHRLPDMPGHAGVAQLGERPPPRPAATQRPGLLAAVIAGEIVAVGDTGLVNRTVAIDLSTWRTIEGTLLKAPWCPACCPVDAP